RNVTSTPGRGPALFDPRSHRLSFLRFQRPQRHSPHICSSAEGRNAALGAAAGTGHGEAHVLDRRGDENDPGRVRAHRTGGDPGRPQARPLTPPAPAAPLAPPTPTARAGRLLSR